MFLVLDGGEQHLWPNAAPGESVNGCSQLVLDQFGVEVFLEDFDFPAHPAVADAPVERRQGFDHEALKALARQTLGQFAAQTIDFALFQQRNHPVHRLVSTDDWLLTGELLAQCRHRLAQQSARALALIHQALDQAQVFDLFGRIHAFATGIAQGLRKAVTPLPDAQRVLAQTSVALDSGDAESAGRGECG